MRQDYRFVWIATVFVLFLVACREEKPEVTEVIASKTPSITTTIASITPNSIPSPTESPPEYPYPKPVYAAPTPRAYPPPELTQMAIDEIPKIHVITQEKPTRTVVEYEFPTPTTQVLNSNTVFSGDLPCRNRGDGSQRCEDDVLELTFDVPFTWGKLTGGLSRGWSGLSYGIFPGEEAAIRDYGLEMGGRSKYYGAPREAFPTDFGGFEHGFESWRCDETEERLSWCEWIIEDRILIAWEFPKAEMVCREPYADVFYLPRVWIIIDLPENDTINGFVFLTNFLSESQVQRLDAAISISDPMQLRVCNPETMANFDRIMTEFAGQVKRGDIDEESQKVLDMIRAVAESIRFR